MSKKVSIAPGQGLRERLDRSNNKVTLIILIYCTLTVLAFFANSTVGFILLLFAVLAFFFWRLYMQSFPVEPGDLFIFYGLPGSGKSMCLTKLAKDNLHNSDYKYFFSNQEFSHCIFMQYLIKRSDFGKLDLNDSFVFYDEGSLDGFDNRDYKSNFTPEILEWHKHVRHNGITLAYSNQGSEEMDKKIRDYLCNKFYYVENKGRFSVAYRIYRTMSVSNLTGQPEIIFCLPTFADRLFNRGAQVYISHRKYGKFYDSYNRKLYQPFPYHLRELHPGSRDSR